MLIQLWNVQAGGGTRIPKILESIKQHNADVVVLCETTWTRFAELQVKLIVSGYDYQHGEYPTGRERGVLIASRVTCERRPASAKEVPGARWSEVHFPGKKFTMAGVYSPDQPKKIAEFWPVLHSVANRRRNDHYLLLGDLNSGHGPLDAESARVAGDAGFSAMPHFGMFDLWRHRHGAAREYTWYSTRGSARSGFRLDHAFGTAAMRRRVSNVRYSHEEREAGLSDHSSMLLTVR